VNPELYMLHRLAGPGGPTLPAFGCSRWGEKRGQGLLLTWAGGPKNKAREGQADWRVWWITDRRHLLAGGFVEGRTFMGRGRQTRVAQADPD